MDSTGCLVQGGWRFTFEYMPDFLDGFGLIEVTPEDRPEGSPESAHIGYCPNPRLGVFVTEMARKGLLRETDHITVGGTSGTYSLPLFVKRYEPQWIELGPTGMTSVEAAT